MSTPTSLPRGAVGTDLFRGWHFLYPLPDPLASLDDWHRSRHEDLAALDDQSLRRERYRCRHRLTCEENPHPWLAERLEALRDELARRGYRR